MSYGIHWFRRDLRVAGNIALQKQFKNYDGRVVGIFCFDKKFLSRPDFSCNRFQFFLETLKSLKKELRQLGSDLLVLDIGPQQAFGELFEKLQSEGLDLPETISWSRDYEPFAIERDVKFEEFLNTRGIKSFSERDHLLIEPWELQKDNGEGYQVYSPFARKWLEIFKTEKIQERIKGQKSALSYLRKLKKQAPEKVFKLTWKKVLKNKIQYPDYLDIYLQKNIKAVDVEIPAAGSLQAFEMATKFKSRIKDYGDKRDIPSLQGTSKLSLYFKNGSLTIAQVVAILGLEAYSKKETGADVYFSELIWREFYYHILYRNRHVEQEAFIEKYRKIKWKNKKQWFEKWKEGETGFPIVDAGMRELKATGWMHNRVRMIVASFLTKDLLIDWRWGERYFMEKLLDGDLAPNNGGWQWAASTGCDPQPYFRIFNPWLQGKRFDPEGDYIRKYVPELKGLTSKELHAPILGHSEYPGPIVEHSTQRDKALALYKS